MSDWKDIGPFWSLSDTYSVNEAAALIAGVDPNAIDASFEYFENKETGLRESRGITTVITVRAALSKAISRPRPKLRAQLRFDAEPRYVAGIDNLEERGRWAGEIVIEIKDWGDETPYLITPQPDLAKTTIDREDLISWLRSRGHTTGFFFPDAANNSPDYLNPKCPHYSHKLAAAVKAWEAVQAEPATKGKTVKGLLAKWLRENAAAYRLTDDAGKVNETGIEEVSKVANWATSGGAPKTPGHEPTHP